VIFDYQGSLTGELISHRYVRPYGARFRLLRSAEAWIDRSADAIVTSCAQARDQILASFPIDPSRVSVVEDGIDTEAFQPAVAAAPARQALGIPAERRVIVYLGLLTPYQGVECLIQAMPRVLARVPQAHLLLLGWPDEQRYRDMAAAAGVGERVTLAGKVEYARSAELLAAGEVAVAPKLSTSESNGKLRHYMACGLPTVAFDLPMNREVLGDLGIYAGAQNSEALAAALVTALSDRSRSAAIGRELRAAAVRDHGWWRAAEKLERVYERQLEGRGP
jgi:glycosyltransferase involved in cell wall biosynthesis